MIDDSNIDFQTDAKIRKHIAGVPGIGNISKTFKIRMPVTKMMKDDLRKLHDVDAVTLIREQLCRETAMLIQQKMNDELLKIKPLAVSIDDLMDTIHSEESVLVNSKLGTQMMDHDKFTKEPFVQLTGRTPSGVLKIGQVGNCIVYVNMIMPFESNHAFVIKENVISLVNATEGYISEVNAPDVILVEGMYNVSTPSPENKHYTVE